MCTIIVTIRSVLWSVMTIAGTLMILVSLFTNRWLRGEPPDTSLAGLANNIMGAMGQEPDLGLFPECKQPQGKLLFEGECVPRWDKMKEKLFDSDDNEYPHAWKGAVLAFAIGLALMLLTVVLSLVTPCLRSCICCSTFTFSGSLQTFAGILFTIGLVAYPAGWGSELVKSSKYCGSDAHSFVLGSCKIGGAYWMAVAGTVCTYLASSLAIFAYKSTKSQKAREREQADDAFICVP